MLSNNLKIVPVCPAGILQSEGNQVVFFRNDKQCVILKKLKENVLFESPEPIRAAKSLKVLINVGVEAIYLTFTMFTCKRQTC